MSFKKATKHQARLRMALIGPAGSGKTYTALKLAILLGKRVAVIDTERGSACHYANKFDFDTCEPESFSPDEYVKTIHEAEQAGYDVLVIDSLSHAWSGKDGALEQVDRVAKRSQSGNSFNAWREVTPKHNALVDAMVGCRCHIIVTMRTKTEYVQEKDDRGKTVIRKVGLQPVQRDGLEYEFDVVGDMTIENDCIIAKTRCEMLTGRVFSKPGDDLAGILQAWLSDSQPRPEQPAATVEHKAEAPKSNGRQGQPVTGPPKEYIHNSICPKECDNKVWQRWSALVLKAQELKVTVWDFEFKTTAGVLEQGKQLKLRVETLETALANEKRQNDEPPTISPFAEEDGADVRGIDELETDAAQAGMGL